ncbi:MAG: hypothetical protein ACLFSN_04250 [Candidatus Woesearchaeota archaeon]
MKIISPEHGKLKFPGNISFLESIIHPELVNKYDGFVHIRKNAVKHGFLNKETKDVPYHLDQEPIFNPQTYSIPTMKSPSRFLDIYENVILPLSTMHNFLFTKIFLHSQGEFPVLHSLDSNNKLTTEAYTMLSRDEYTIKNKIKKTAMYLKK